MAKVVSLLKKYCLAFYWLAFAVFTIFAAKVPGYYGRGPVSVANPWVGILLMWGLLAAGVAILHLILRPFAIQRSWRRIGIALLYLAALLVFCVLATPEEMPGLAYVPSAFALVGFLGVAAYAVAVGASEVWRRVRRGG